MKKFVLIAVIAVAVLSLTGCNQTVHGGGVVAVVGGYSGSQTLTPGNATMALTTMCNDHKDAVMTSFVWNDQTNGVQFTARLPWTPVSELTAGTYTTCDELAAGLDPKDEFHGAVTMANINAQGQQVGQVEIEVTQPGQGLVAWGEQDVCGGTESNVGIATLSSDGPTFMVIGCLDKGKLVFQ